MADVVYMFVIGRKEGRTAQVASKDTSVRHRDRVDVSAPSGLGDPLYL